MLPSDLHWEHPNELFAMEPLVLGLHLNWDILHVVFLGFVTGWLYSVQGRHGLITSFYEIHLKQDGL